MMWYHGDSGASEVHHPGTESARSGHRGHLGGWQASQTGSRRSDPKPRATRAAPGAGPWALKLLETPPPLCPAVLGLGGDLSVTQSPANSAASKNASSTLPARFIRSIDRFSPPSNRIYIISTEGPRSDPTSSHQPVCCQEARFTRSTLHIDNGCFRGICLVYLWKVLLHVGCVARKLYSGGASWACEFARFVELSHKTESLINTISKVELLLVSKTGTSILI